MEWVLNLGDNVGLGDGGFEVPTFLEKKPIETNELKGKVYLGREILANRNQKENVSVGGGYLGWVNGEGMVKITFSCPKKRCLSAIGCAYTRIE